MVDGPDPEVEFAVELRVVVTGFGKRRARRSVAYSVAKLLGDTLPSATVMLVERELVPYDSVTDDGHSDGFRPSRGVTRQEFVDGEGTRL